jgi:hypothetical protein
VGALGFLVLEFAEVHQTTDGWLRHGGDFYQINAAFFSRCKGCAQRNDAELLGVDADETNLLGGNFVVDALRLILGDGSFLQKKQQNRLPRLN